MQFVSHLNLFLFPGSEGQFTDCNHDNVDQGQTEECKKNYAAVACFSGSKPTGIHTI